MKNNFYFQKALFIMTIMICSINSFAQFSGLFAPANWNFNSTTIGGDGYVNVSGAPASIILSGSDNGGSSCCSQYEQYSITIPSNGKISFDYNHSNPDIDDAQYIINGIATNITTNGSGSLANIVVNSGDVFSFRVTNNDNCCGRGVLTISNFLFNVASALSFNGANDYVQLTDPNFGTSDFTLETFMKPNTANGAYLISTRSVEMGGAGNWFALHYNSGKIGLELSDEGFGTGYFETGGTPVTLGAWNHVVLVRAGLQFSIYVNGILSASYTDLGLRNFNTGMNSIRLSGWANVGVAFFDGMMDETRFWNVARTQCEINTFMNCEIPNTSAGLIANYHFNQGIDGGNNTNETLLTDASGNLNDGTLNNFVLTGATSNWISPGAVVNGYTSTLAPTVISVNSGAICSGQSFTFVPSGAATYTFSNGSDIVTPTADATYSVSGTDVNGCVSLTDAISIVTVNALPLISVNDGAICSGQSFTIVPSGADSYVYSSGSDVVNPTVNATYTVTGTNTLTTCSAVAESAITVNNLPLISVNSGAICIGQAFTIVPSGAATYTYSNGSDIVTPTADTTYSVGGTDANGCVSLTDAISSVTVNALPILLANTSNTLICSGETALLSATGATSYTWSTTDNTTNVAVSPTVQTTYTIEGTDANGCVNSTTIMQDVSLCTGIVELSRVEAQSNSVFPNPNNGSFIVELINTSTISVTNYIGQLIMTGSMAAGKHNIDIQNQSTGIYFVKVIQGVKQHVIKLIKE